MLLMLASLSSRARAPRRVHVFMCVCVLAHIHIRVAGMCVAMLSLLRMLYATAKRDRVSRSLRAYVMDNSSTLFELHGNNKNNKKKRIWDMHTLAHTARQHDRMITVAAAWAKRRWTDVSQIAILYEWSNQVLNVRLAYALYTIRCRIAPTIQYHVCSIRCSSDHLHESIERLRYTDRSSNETTNTVATDVVDCSTLIICAVAARNIFRTEVVSVQTRTPAKNLCELSPFRIIFLKNPHISKTFCDKIPIILTWRMHND